MFPPSPRFPIEIQESILEHLWPGDKWPEADALANCALTCSDWRYVVNKGLYNQVELLGKDKYYKLLDTLLKTKDSHDNHYPSKIRTLVIHDATPAESISRIALHTLPHLLDHLEELFIFGPHGSKNAVFHTHPSIFATLPQFRQVHSLYLHYIEFDSLAQLRKILGSLPGLNSAIFRRVTWRKPEEMPFKPLFNATSWRLSTFSLSDCPSDYIAPFFWAQPPHVSSRSHQYKQNTRNASNSSHPSICAADVYPLVQLAQSILGPSEKMVGSVCWEWKQLEIPEYSQICEFSLFIFYYCDLRAL